MLNLIRFLFGARAVSEDALNLSNQIIGSAIYLRVCKNDPDFKSDDPGYLKNTYLQEQSDKIFAGRQKELLKIQENIAQQLEKLFI